MKSLNFFCTMISIAVVLFSANSYSEAYWRTEGSKTLTTITIERPKGRVFLSLIIYFNPEISCFPEIGFLIAEGDILGKFEGHQWAKDKMSIVIDSNSPWLEKTAISKYSNGYETTIIGNEKLIGELKHGSIAKIAPFKGAIQFVFPLDGSASAIGEARSNCNSK